MIASDISPGLTTKQAAHRLGVTPEKLRDLIAAGHLLAINVSLGKRAKYRVLPEHIEAFIAARSTRSSPPVRRVRRQPGNAVPSRY